MLMERDTDASERVSASVPGKVELATHDTKVCSLQAIIVSGCVDGVLRIWHEYEIEISVCYW